MGAMIDYHKLRPLQGVEKMGEVARAVLICGFLGSGKTTLLKEILSWKEELTNVAIIVNEFGEVGIDGALLSQQGANVVELTSGCICCSIQGDLKTTILDISERYSPNWLLVEATGLADPAGILPLFQAPEVSSGIILHKSITVMDVEYWEGREVFGPLFDNQLKLADLILLNKVDLVPKERVPGILKEVMERFPAAQIVPTVYAKVDPDLIFLPSARNVIHAHNGEFPMVSHGHHHHPHHRHLEPQESFSFQGYTSYVFEEECVLGLQCLKILIKTLPLHVFRIKGWISTDEGPFFINLAGGKGTWDHLSEPKKNKLAFIGWDIDKHALREKIEACKV